MGVQPQKMKNPAALSYRYSQDDLVCQFLGQSDHHTAGKVVRRLKSGSDLTIFPIQIREKVRERVNFVASYLDNRLELRDK